ncbi:MAG: neutral/alkaline non-lysosomal ceramidase N-terminal domain-containing protein [Lentisphaeria bacterium]|nr:neutral/alkaline non-lysosomal ceramidase N-terminal domain-containing protein [Lentisphaeria bacterium]
MRAGFGKCDITPRLGVELYGFGPFANRKSIAVRDIIEARSAALECNGYTVIIVSLDLCLITPETAGDIRQAIREKYPFLKTGDIMLNTSHTHSAPGVSDNPAWGITDPVWLAMLPGKVIKSVDQALAGLKPVKVSTALVPCRHIGLNRVYDLDAPPLSDVLQEDWEPAKPELTDTSCRVIRFDSTAGKMLGFMVYFGCHPVIGSRSNHHLHGDFPAVAIHRLMAEFPGSTGIFLQGAEGDVNSCCVHKGESESLHALDIIADRFAAAVRDGLNQAQEVEINSIKSVSREFFFKWKPLFTMEKLNEIEKEQSAILYADDASDSSFECRMAWVYLDGIKQIRTLLQQNISGTTGELHIIRIGDFQFMGIPFEVMQAIKNDIVAASHAKYPMVMSLTNGSLGYAPDNHSIRQLDRISKDGRQGNYEAIQTPLAAGRPPFADIHNELVNGMLSLENELNKEQNS